MKKKFGLTIGMLCLVTASACVMGSEAQLKSNVDPSGITHSASHAERINQFISAYSSCLSKAWNRTSVSRLNAGKLPLLEAQIYEKQCISQERDLYIAFYSGAFGGDPNANPRKKHDTGQKGVLAVKKATFDAIYEDFTDVQQ